MHLKINSQLFIIWLFHLSAIIGISSGYSDWFLSKTPLNLCVLLLVMILSFNLKNIRNLVAFIVIVILGFSVEVLGVHFAWFFGKYSYGDNFGIKLFDVPLLIGVNWGILSLTSYTIVSTYVKKLWLKAVLAALLMLTLDYLMEYIAPRFDFWEFHSEAVPFRNYVSWFLFAFLFILICHFLKVKGSVKTAAHIFGVQLIFFLYFYGYF
ncbi:MAG: carotenoid biosynthesis protein [Psychroflexus sp.]|nr:carotenoid biosynthesis protein [Psychroflexus sp.]MDN6310057.1 carotenoid biosynthesis protein [Psychroflexus sp.]